MTSQTPSTPATKDEEYGRPAEPLPQLVYAAPAPVDESSDLSSSKSRSCCERGPHRPIFILSSIYCCLVVFMFAALASLDNELGLDALGKVLGILFFVGGPAVIIAVISFVLTMIRWRNISQLYRAIGLFPVVCSVTIIVVLAILGNVNSTSTDDVSPPCYETGGSDCPQAKNVTDLDW